MEFKIGQIPASVLQLQCAKQCMETRRFVCRSFVYDKEQRHCTLWNVNLRLLADSESNSLVEDDIFHYYELVSQSGNLHENLAILAQIFS